MDGDRAAGPGGDSAPAFIPGLLLNERFFAEVVRPILAAAFPGLRYCAATIGYGSEVLGYDTPRSMDHEWGPRLVLLVADAEHEAVAGAMRATLSQRLPPRFLGFSTHFGPPGPDGSRVPAPGAGGSIDHKIEVHSPHILTSWLGVDPFVELSAADWLLMPRQTLLEVTAGRVYYDGLGVLGPVREKLAFYPHDVWLYLLAAQWQRMSQAEAFVGRTGEVGDELGSALVAATLVRDLMGLGFLLERRYAPYSKWFGTAFAELSCAPRLTPLFETVLQAGSWREREDGLAEAYELVAGLHNALGVTVWVDPTTRPFHNRPFQVLHAERFADATVDAIEDRDVLAIVDRAGLIGAVDQFSDNVDLLTRSERTAKLRSLYE
ncbi:MAG: DUF4037 domain-containing protein [Chloroflexia bacterium]|nr:DUF4037 domain-containing protein [Chloroflexia bacterium]